MNDILANLERLVKEFTPPWAIYRGCPRRFSDFVPPGEFYVLLPLDHETTVGLFALPVIEKHTLVCHQETFEKALADLSGRPFPPTVDELTAICIYAALNQPKPSAP